MAGTGIPLAEAFVRIDSTGPDKAKIAADTKAATAGVSGTVPIYADLKDFASKLAAAQTAIRALQGRKATLLLDLAGDKAAQAKLLAIGVKIDQLSRKVASPKITIIGVDRAIAQVAALDVALDSIQASADRATVASTALWTSVAAGGFTAAVGFKLAHLGVTLFGAQLALDTIGITAFGIATANAIGPIVSNWSTLTTTWGALDNLQKGFVLNLKNYLATLSQGSEGGVFTVLNEGLSVLKDFGQGGGVVQQATIAFERFGAMLNSVFTGPAWQSLVHGTGGLVNQDLTTLFSLVSQIVGVLPELIHSFNSWGTETLNIVKNGIGLLGFLSKLDQATGNVVSKIGAVLTAWSLLAHFTPIVGPFQLLGRGIAALGLNAISATGALTNMRQFGILPTIGFMTGLSGAGLAAVGAFAALGAAAVAFVVIANNLSSPVTGLINNLAKQDQAVGDNAAGYAKLNDQLNAYLNHTKQLPSGVAARSLIEIAQAEQVAGQRASVLATNFGFLSKTYGLTAQGAIHVADTLGINLTQALTGNSKAAREARFEIANYIKTTNSALSPLGQFDYDIRQINKDAGNQAARTQDLANAYTALLGPITGVEAAAGQLWPSFQALNKAVKADGTEVGLYNPKAADLAGKLGTATQNAIGLSTSVYNMTGNLTQALRPTGLLVDKIFDLHLKGQLAKSTTDLLVQSQFKLGQQAGLSTGAIVGLISQLDKIPKNEVISILMSGKGTYTIGQQVGSGVFKKPGVGGGFAYGGRVPGSGTRDTVPAMLTPGEAIVPKHLVPHVAPFLGAHRVPGFASGGYVGTGPGIGAGLGNFADTMVSAFRNQMTAAMVTEMRNALQSAERSAAQAFRSGPSAFGGSGPAMAFARALLPSYGWGSQWGALFQLWQRESGWNPYAVNPSSGAYGIPQSLGHGHPYALGDYANQIRWGLSYIRSTYGSPDAAWAHELAFGWYDKGGFLPPGLSLALNKTGRAEPVGAAAGGDIHVHVHVAPGAVMTGNSVQIGQALAQYLLEATKRGASLYPVGVKPR